MEKYLKGEVKQKATEERMMNAYLLGDEPPADAGKIIGED
jgi:hypothetical protein